ALGSRPRSPWSWPICPVAGQSILCVRVLCHRSCRSGRSLRAAWSTGWSTPRRHGASRPRITEEKTMTRQQLRRDDDQAVTAPAWTVESVRSLGLTTTGDNAASILGISRTKAYALAKQGEFPVKLVRAGRRYLVPVPALLLLLTHGPAERD